MQLVPEVCQLGLRGEFVENELFIDFVVENEEGERFFFTYPQTCWRWLLLCGRRSVLSTESTNKIHREFKIAETSFFFFFSFPILSFHKSSFLFPCWCSGVSNGEKGVWLERPSRVVCKPETWWFSHLTSIAFAWQSSFRKTVAWFCSSFIVFTVATSSSNLAFFFSLQHLLFCFAGGRSNTFRWNLHLPPRGWHFSLFRGRSRPPLLPARWLSIVLLFLRFSVFEHFSRKHCSFG